MQEYDYLLSFAHEANMWHERAIQQEGEKDKEPAHPWPPLMDLPNFAFSVALARYSLETERKEEKSEVSNCFDNCRS